MIKADEKELIVQTAKHLREVFKSRRQMYLSLIDPDANYSAINPIWDGAEDGRGVKRKAIWPGLADFALLNKIDVVTWVDTLFSHLHLFHGAPEPGRLRDPRVIKALGGSKERLQADRLQRISSQLGILLTKLFHAQSVSALPPDTVAKTVLVHPELDASALIRYVVARRLKLEDTAKIFTLAAAVEHQVDPAGYAQVIPQYKVFLNELPAIKSEKR